VAQYIAANQYTLHIFCGIHQNFLRGGDMTRHPPFNGKSMRYVKKPCACAELRYDTMYSLKQILGMSAIITVAIISEMRAS
jgi:hypothetical protein